MAENLTGSAEELPALLEANYITGPTAQVVTKTLMGAAARQGLQSLMRDDPEKKGRVVGYGKVEGGTFARAAFSVPASTKRSPEQLDDELREKLEQHGIHAETQNPLLDWVHKAAQRPENKRIPLI